MSNTTGPTETGKLPPFTVSPEYQAAKKAQQATAIATQVAGVVASSAVATVVKPGWQTTEFWLHVAGIAGPLVLQALGQSQSALAVAIAQAAPMLYTIARTYLKSRGIVLSS